MIRARPRSTCTDTLLPSTTLFRSPVQPAMPAEFPVTSSGGGVPVVIGGSGGWGGSGGFFGGFFGGGGSGGGSVVVSSTTSGGSTSTGGDRKSGVSGKSVSGRVDIGGRRLIKTKN